MKALVKDICRNLMSCAVCGVTRVRVRRIGQREIDRQLSQAIPGEQ